VKLAIISDIHANLHALEAVWEDLETQQPDVVYCLGDLVGYGAYPNETIAFLREHEIPTIMGNYDEGVGFDLHDCGCVYKDPVQDRLGQQSLICTRERTSLEHKQFLQTLPLQIRLEETRPRIMLVHGSPRKINEYLYEDRPDATFERIAKLAGTDIVLFGHTHLPYEKRVYGTTFINCGSVGKPKDGNPAAGYVILSPGRKPQVKFRRVSYDVAAAAQAVRESGLPHEFGAQLESGGKQLVRT
jgi:putative phosphoesterase